MKLPSFTLDCQPMAAMAPSFMLNEVSGIRRSGSNSILYPSPAHTGHAPNGLLNEKLLGSISSMLTPQSGQAKFLLKFICSPPCTSTVKSPSESCSAVSMESASRDESPLLTMSLSTTISMSCFTFLSSSISSESSYKFPSMRTRTYPLFFALSRTFSCRPFFPLTMGESS